jgi:hypothetical protein
MERCIREGRRDRTIKRGPLSRSFSPLLWRCGLPEREFRDWA